MPIVKFSTTDTKKPTGFFEFATHKDCFVLVTREGTVHYGDKSSKCLSSLNWNDYGTKYEYKRVPVPAYFDLKGHRVHSSAGNMLLVCPNAKSH